MKNTPSVIANVPPPATPAVSLPTGGNVPKIENQLKVQSAPAVSPGPSGPSGGPGIAGENGVPGFEGPSAEELVAPPLPDGPRADALGLKPVRKIPGALVKAASIRPADELQHFFVTTFNVRGVGIRMVEVPHTQNPKLDVESAWRAVRVQYPTAGTNDIRRINSKVESRPVAGVPAIKLTDGMTIRQLFPDGSPFEASRPVGRVVFDGEPCEVVLRHLRAKSVFSLTLRSRTSGNATRFSEQITVMRLASELPTIIEGMLDGNAPGLELYFTK